VRRHQLDLELLSMLRVSVKLPNTRRLVSVPVPPTATPGQLLPVPLR
jgi:hypothetical protein